MANAAYKQLNYIYANTVVVAIEAGLLVISLALSIWAAIQSTRAANQASANSQAELRPYMAVESSNLHDGTTTNPPIPAHVDRPATIMLVRNVGKTPAKNVVHWAAIAVSDSAQPVLPVPANMAGAPKTNIAPGGVTTKTLLNRHVLTQGEKVDIQLGTKGIFVYGAVTYDDTFGKSWVTNYRLVFSGVYPPPAGGVALSFCVEGNDAS